MTTTCDELKDGNTFCSFNILIGMINKTKLTLFRDYYDIVTQETFI